MITSPLGSKSNTNKKNNNNHTEPAMFLYGVPTVSEGRRGTQLRGTQLHDAAFGRFVSSGDIHRVFSYGDV